MYDDRNPESREYIFCFHSCWISSNVVVHKTDILLTNTPYSDLYVWYCWHLKYDQIIGKNLPKPCNTTNLWTRRAWPGEESRGKPAHSWLVRPPPARRLMTVSNKVEESWTISCAGQQLPSCQVCPKCSLSSDLSASCCCKLQKGRSLVLFFVCFWQKNVAKVVFGRYEISHWALFMMHFMHSLHIPLSITYQP